jgi:hypothetical protein
MDALIYHHFELLYNFTNVCTKQHCRKAASLSYACIYLHWCRYSVTERDFAHISDCPLYVYVHYWG